MLNRHPSNLCIIIVIIIIIIIIILIEDINLACIHFGDCSTFWTVQQNAQERQGRQSALSIIIIIIL